MKNSATCCFRVRARKDVDLALGHRMLNARWHAHTLNAPGKFLVSTPEHTTPKRARAYLITDDDVARVVAYYGPRRPQLALGFRGGNCASDRFKEKVPLSWPGGPGRFHPPGFHRTERDSLPSFRSSHLIR